MPRFHCPLPMGPGDVLDLPSGATRHVQVLRLQPGETIALFHGGLPQDGMPQDPTPEGWFEAEILAMGRSQVTVRVDTWHAALPDDAPRIHLATGVPAGDRMDWLVEKATELGVASIQPLMTARSVLRLKGDRADKKQAHWQAVAVSACEQSGRTRVPLIHPVREAGDWIAASPPHGLRCCLSLQPQAEALRALPMPLAGQPVWLLSGPEGGLTAQEEAQATAQGFRACSLGPYTLRADTAPLAALAALMLR